MMKGENAKWKMLLLVCIGIAFHFPLSTFHTAQAQIRRTDASGNGSGSVLSSARMPIGNNSQTNNGQSQGLFDSDSTFRDSTATTGLQYHKEIPDSVLRRRVFFFNYRPTYVKIDQLWNPTLDPTGVHRADCLDDLNGNYYLGKGVIGHPHVSLFPTLADGLDMQLMPDPNIGYAKRPYNIRLYQTMTPYTVLSYNSSLNKDYLVRVAHTQNIRPGWNVSMDYRLIAPQGIYTASGAKNHYLDATTNYFSRDARLQVTAGIIWQSFRIDENGGIADDTYFTSSLQSNRAGIPVNMYNMGTRHKELAAFGHASYNLVRQFESYRYRDSLVARTAGDSIVLDTVEVVDTLRVGTPRVLNAGTFGVEVNYDRRKRAFQDSTLWQELSASLFWTNDVYPDYRWRNPFKLTIGISPRIIKANIYDDVAELHSWLDPFARAEISIGRGTMTGEADMRGSFNDQGVPDSRFSASFVLPLDSAGNSTVGLSAVWQNKMPDVLMQYFANVNQNLVLASVKTERYGMSLNIKDIAELNIKATHLNHNVWCDSLKVVHDGKRDLWLYQAALIMHMRFGWLNIDMQQLLQSSTDSLQMPVPTWASKNSIYADLHLFGGAVHAQIGADIRYHTLFHAPGYDPYTGLFYNQDEVLVGNYIWGDIFLNVNVKRASFYIKAGHLNALWESSPNYFLLPHYPGQKFGLFWGITWHFFD